MLLANIRIYFYILGYVIFTTGDSPPEKCERLWYKVGCYRDRIFPNRPYFHELVNHRNPINSHWDGHLIDWKRWPESLHALACRCAELARKRNYEFFGLQFYGECWSGANLNFFRDGQSHKCVGGDFKRCNDTGVTECVGEQYTNYIYKLKEKMLT